MDFHMDTVPIMYPAMIPTIIPLIQGAVDESLDGISLRYVLEQLEQAKALLWYIQGNDCNGIIITCHLEDLGHTDLFVWLLYGKAIGIHAREIQNRLERFGIETGCRAMRAVVSNEKLLNLLINGLDYLHVGHVVFKELKNVRTISE